MKGYANASGEGQLISRRPMAWVITPFALLVPLITMHFTDEVNWSVGDFVIAGALLVGVGIAFELVVRMSGNTVYRAACGVALAAAFLLVWINGAVGIIGNEGTDANLMFGGVLAVGIISAAVARFRPDGMASAMFVTAAAQALVGAVALIAGLGATGPIWPWDIIGANAFFAALWIGSGLLFRKAAKEQGS